MYKQLEFEKFKIYVQKDSLIIGTMRSKIFCIRRLTIHWLKYF